MTMTQLPERFAGLLDDEKRANFEWLVSTITPDNTTSMLLWGYCATIAVEHQDWTFWEMLEEARKKFVVKRTVIL
jgi:hypothetical protein